MKEDNEAAARQTFDFDVFISYSRKDLDVARAFERALRGYRPPHEGGTPPPYLKVFRDQSDMTGTDYSSSIRKHLENSRKLLVVCSPDAARSKYVDDEIATFAKLHGAEHIVPVLWRGLPNNEVTDDSRDSAAFPPQLTAALSMPLAAEYRGCPLRLGGIRRGDFAQSWFWVLSNLLGKPREEIEQREMKRQQRSRNRWIGGLSVVAAMLAGLTVWALISAAEARRQAKIARAGELVAESRALQGAQVDVAQRRAMIAAEAVARLQRVGAGSADANRGLADALGRLPLRILSFDAHPKPAAFTFAADGLSLFRASGGKLQRWHLSSGRLEAETAIASDAAMLVMSPRRSEVGVLDERGQFTVWEFGAANARRVSQPVANVKCAAIDATGARSATVVSAESPSSQELQIREISGDKLVYRLRLPEASHAERGEADNEPCVEFSPAESNATLVLVRLRYQADGEVFRRGALVLNLPAEAHHEVITLLPTAWSARQLERLVRAGLGKYFHRAGAAVNEQEFANAWVDDVSKAEIARLLEEATGIELPSSDADSLETLEALIGWYEAQRWRSRHPANVREWRDGERIQFVRDRDTVLDIPPLIDIGKDLVAIEPPAWGTRRVAAGTPSAVSPDRSRYALWISDGEDPVVPLLRPSRLEIRQSSDGEMRAVIPGSGGRLARFTLDSSALITAVGPLVRYWAVNGGEEIYRLNARHPVSALLESPGGRYLAVSAEDHSVDVWDIAHPQERLRVPEASAASLSNDGERLALVMRQTLQVIDVANARLVVMAPLMGAANLVQWSSDRRYLAATRQRGAFEFMEPGSAYPCQLFDMQQSAKQIWSATECKSAAFSPDARAVAFVSLDGKLTLLDLPTATPRWTLTRPGLRGVTFAATGSTLLADVQRPNWNANDSQPGALVLQASDGAIKRTIDGEGVSATDAEASRIAIARHGEGVIVYRVADGSVLNKLVPPPTLSDVYGLAFAGKDRLNMLTSNKASTFIGASFHTEEAVISWDLKRNGPFSQLPTSKNTARDYTETLVQEEMPYFEGTVLGMDGRYAAARVFTSKGVYWEIGSDYARSHLSVWDLEPRVPREIFRQPGGRVLQITPGGASILVRTEDSIRVWSTIAPEDPHALCARINPVPTREQWEAVLGAEEHELSCP